MDCFLKIPTVFVNASSRVIYQSLGINTPSVHFISNVKTLCVPSYGSRIHLMLPASMHSIDF